MPGMSEHRHVTGKIYVDDVMMPVDWSWRRVFLSNTQHLAKEFAGIGFDLYLGKNDDPSDPSVWVAPQQSEKSSFKITDRTPKQYFEMFPSLEKVLQTGANVYELGPGLSSFYEAVQSKGCTYTGFDFAPYELIYALSDCTLQQDKIDDKLGINDYAERIIRHWRSQCEKILRGEVRVVRGAFPETLSQQSAIQRPDVIVEYNGPIVSLFKEQDMKALLKSHRGDAVGLLQHCQEDFQAYIRTLFETLAPGGFLCLQAGIRPDNSVHLEMAKEEGLAVTAPR